MTIFSKVLAVLVTAVSLAFLGFVAIGLKAGRNWGADANKVEAYDFTQTPGAVPTWAAAPRGKDANPLPAVASTPVLPEAILKAQLNVQDRLKADIDALDQQIAQYEPALKQFPIQRDIDIQAMKNREAELVERANVMQRQIEQMEKDGSLLTERATTTETTAADRRDEILRQQNLLAAVEADKHRWIEQKKTLENRLIQLRGDIAALERAQSRLPAVAGATAGP